MIVLTEGDGIEEGDAIGEPRRWRCDGRDEDLRENVGGEDLGGGKFFC